MSGTHHKMRLKATTRLPPGDPWLSSEAENTSGNTCDLVLITAHLGSSKIQSGPITPAPGADGDASGSAGLLEMARVCTTHQSAHELRLMLFGGEEEGLFESTQYVVSLAESARSRIRAVVNMEMNGNIHSINGTIEHINDLAVEVLRMHVAFLGNA